MKLNRNTVLITGGSSGIGMALAERFLARGNEVIICGRREESLRQMKDKYPALQIKVSDMGKPEDRIELAHWVTRQFPKLNILINNAGIQRKFNFLKPEDWGETTSEIDINFSGPIHLTSLLIPHLLQQAESHIVNVSSGLAFVPLAHMPIYCATKAAIHSLTMSLRQQLIATSITVTELIPPAVKTNLGGAHDFGVELAEFADSTMAQFADGKSEVTYGFSSQTSQLSRQGIDETFLKINGNFKF